MSIYQLLSSLGIFTFGTVVITSVVGFIAKSIFNSWLSAKVNEHKNKLEKQTESYKHTLQNETEKFKMELQKKSYEHQVKYNKLHTERADVVKDFYTKLTKMESSMRDLFNIVQLSGDAPKDIKVSAAGKSFDEAMDYFDSNRILFNEYLCGIVDTLREEILTLWNDFTSYDLHLEKLNDIREFRQEQVSVWKNCWNTMKREIPIIKRDLEKEFRQLLGVES